MTKEEIAKRIIKTDWKGICTKGISVTMANGAKLPEPSIKEVLGFVNFLFNNQNSLSLHLVDMYSTALFPNYFYRSE